ncbi:ATP-grasp domain-containing protein [Amycolatopsis sp. GM8]|uniref:ATP-grasp domain-containing protein n=1 Tax=Amycolatopsis sp. GM8 TaxID=2896530 RepID=UPI001F166905|nr:ATP-grasp domain-containing protein [Amycolatopsis sp. GM8]
MNRATVVIVDPYSSGVSYAPALRRAGFSPVAVLSWPRPADSFTKTFRPGDFDEVLTADAGDLLGRLAGLTPVAVLPGAESGVALADRLAQRLTPELAHVPELAASRSHKGHMARAMQAAGLAITPTLCVRDPRHATDALASPEFAGHDLVVKPATSVSTDGVTLVPAGEDWRPAVTALLGRTNATGVVNDEVVIQRRMFGTEYVVNTFSHNGRHVVTDVCRYTKIAVGDSFAVYQDVEFLPTRDPAHADLIDYVRRSLDALGFRFGPAHTEVMSTEEGPRLVEINSRIAGSGMAAAAELATGDSGVRRTVRYLLGTRDFLPDVPHLRSVTVAMFVARQGGVVSNVEVLDQIRQLPTCRRLEVRVRNGDPIAKTSDLLSSLRLGWALFAHRDAGRVHADHTRAQGFAAQLVTV